jgi:phosphopantothenoylcysteine decarboxylase/phosphopantothenate--cysteine ligase
VVVTAGPTRELLDPVRFLSNRSSGKQGLALAQSAVDHGASVTLITGPVELGIPISVKHVSVQTANEMLAAVLDAVVNADALLMAAAVSDYRPASVSENKIKKSDGDAQGIALELARNPDILEAIGENRTHSGFPRLTVGFAAETDKVEQYGRDKLRRKGLDMIAINDVSASDAGFSVDTNRITLLRADGSSENWPLLTKSDVADRLIDAVADGLKNGPG